jgi:two-component system cell cycle sensor histidine kinase/response regulator CckA
MLVSEDIDLKIKCVEKELVVMADKGQIEQVLINLVTNAREAMPRVGAMTIEVLPAIIDDEFIHLYGYGKPGNYACLSVADTGNGMDKETKEKIFEPFFTKKEVGKRSGLGLAIVYGIIKQHNGFIGVFSEEGKGTTFRVYLPLIYDKISDSNKIISETPSAGGTETILLAEDDAILRELNRLILSSAGYSVIEAVDGEDALNKFMVHQNEIDILTFDVIMPKIDGKKAYEEISKVRPELKVIFMSGYAKDIIDRECFMKDEVSFMAKPLMPSDLLNKVRYLLDN